MEQLHGHGGRQELRALAAAAEEHEHGAQALAACRQRVRGVAPELAAVAARYLAQALLGSPQEPRERRSSRGKDRRELLRGALQLLTPAWMAMIPPAVSTQRTPSSPAAAISPARPSGAGKRRTELGR